MHFLITTKKRWVNANKPNKQKTQDLVNEIPYGDLLVIMIRS